MRTSSSGLTDVWMLLAGSALVFFIDVATPAQLAASIGYIGIVLLTLRSSQQCLTNLVASLATLCIGAALLLEGALRTPLSDPVLTAVFVIAVVWMTAAHGTARHQLLSTANQSQPAPALSPTRSAAQAADRLDMVLKSSGMRVWDWDVKSNSMVLDGELGRAQEFLVAAAAKDARGFIETTAHPDDQADVRSKLAAALDRGSDFSLRFRVLYPDQSIHVINLQGKVFRDPQGDAVRVLCVTRDITSEVEAAANIVRQTETQRNLLDRINLATQTAGITVADRDLRTGEVHRDDNAYRVFGITPDSAVDAFREATHPEDRPMVDERIAAGMSGRIDGDILSIRYRIIRQTDGATRHLQTYRRLFRDDAGKVVRILGVAWDVTEEVQYVEQLGLQGTHERKLLMRLSVAAKAARISPWEFDLATKTFLWDDNRSPALGLDNVPIAELTARAAQLIHPDDRSRPDEAMAEAIARGGDEYEYKFRIVKAGDCVRHMQSFVRIIRDENNNPVRTVGATADITNEVHTTELLQRQAEQQRALTDRLKIATDSAGINSWEIDIPTRKITWLERSQGSQPDDRLKTDQSLDDLDSVFHPDEAGMFDRILAEAIATKSDLLSYRLRISGREGNYIHLQNHARIMFDTAGQPTSALGVSWDITKEIEAAQALLKATEAAQAASRAKSELLANVSHEIRTPMNGIIGMTRLLLESSLDDAQSQYAETIRGSADSLLRVINDILDFSKIEAGKIDLERVEMDVRRAVHDVSSAMAFQAAEKQLRFSVHVADDVPMLVLGDSQRIRQCLINLVGNAVKFTLQGAVVLNVRRIDAPDNERLTRFEVCDTGIGISEASMENLFTPFVQADASTTRNFGGTGLGLSIVKRLVGMMGGSVGVSSKLGHGSRFWFDVPLPISLGSTESAIATPDADGNGRAFHRQAVSAPMTISHSGKVLVVEDNVVNQKVAKNFLQRLGCEVVIAQNGVDAIDKFHAERFDIVFMDLQMPVMDGFTATARIRQMNGVQARTPIVALTANAMEGQQEQCMLSGMDGFLTKPLNVDRLREVLDQFGLRKAEPSAPSADARSANRPTTDSPAAPVDLAKLYEVTDGDVDFTAELLATFYASVAEILAEIAQHQASGDRLQVATAAHKLKGAGANIHAHAVSLCASRLENDIAAMDAQQLSRQIEQLNKLAGETIEYLQENCTVAEKSSAA